MQELIDRQALIKDMRNNKTEKKCPCYPNCYPCDFSEARRIIDIQPTIEAEIDRAALLRLCNEIEMIIVTVCDTGYTLQDGDIEAIMKRIKAIREEVRKDAGTDD